MSRIPRCCLIALGLLAQPVLAGTAPPPLAPPPRGAIARGVTPAYLRQITAMAKHGLTYVKSSAQRGNVTAQLVLAMVYSARRDYTTAAKWYQSAARQGNPNAEEYLGLLYVNGLGVAKNYKKGLHVGAPRGNAE